ncbi:MAG: dodecin family protein [Vampirovibrio sp.]|nr:dodecin family protein [Vampirovibrio sp.]
MLKVIEVLAESEKSWEDATRQAVAGCAKTVENIRSCYVQEFSTVVDNNAVTKFRVNVKISFEVTNR